MTTLQQVNYDDYASKAWNGWEYTLEDVSYRIARAIPVDEAKLSLPHSRLHHGFRIMALDTTQVNSDGFSQNIWHNAFVNANFRASVHCRHPYDRAQVVRRRGYVARGLFTEDSNLVLDSDPLTQDAQGAQPFFRAPGEAKRFALLDVPRKSVGLHSLGQLQHAPLVNVPWASSMPVGNSLLAAQDIPTDRTALTLSEEAALWAGLPRSPFKFYFAQICQHLDKAGYADGAGAVAITEPSFFDWSLELNHALWDRYHFSGIPLNNNGWGRGGWDLGKGVDSARNSRYEQVVAPPTAGYFATPNFDAYRAAYTLLQKGAFNVNSTSVVAWKSLLSAFRGVTLPLAGGGSGGDASSTPYSRNLFPVSRAYTGTQAENSAELWGGFRSLSDDELQVLAEKIVIEVKKRGPFLSLSDFVNRRLKSATGSSPAARTTQAYADWDKLENDFLGTLQAAIENAELNKSLTPAASAATGMNRTTPDLSTTAITCGVANPSHKAKSKFAGAPGYLLQSDILQQIGSALSARSDTFTIRSAGLADDGTRAYVEVVAQRVPEPLARAESGTDVPVNPKSVKSGDAAGNQWMGRRFVIVSTKWITEDRI